MTNVEAKNAVYLNKADLVTISPSLYWRNEIGINNPFVWNKTWHVVTTKEYGDTLAPALGCNTTLCALNPRTRQCKSHMTMAGRSPSLRFFQRYGSILALTGSTRNGIQRTRSTGSAQDEGRTLTCDISSMRTCEIKMCRWLSIKWSRGEKRKPPADPTLHRPMTCKQTHRGTHQNSMHLGAAHMSSRAGDRVQRDLISW